MTSDQDDGPAEKASGGRSRSDRYLIKSLVHATEILAAFQRPRREPAPARRHGPHGVRQGHVLPPALHAAPLRLPREGGAQPLPARGRDRTVAAATASATPAQGQDTSFAREAAPGAGTRRRARAGRAGRRRQPPPVEGRLPERRVPDPRGRRPRDRVPDRRGGGAGDRLQVPGRQDPRDRDRRAAPRSDLLRRQQLRGRAAGGPLPRPLGEHALGRARRRDPAAGARAGRLAAARQDQGRARGNPRDGARTPTPAASSRSTATGSSRSRSSACARYLRELEGAGTCWWAPATTRARSGPRGRSRRPGVPRPARSSARTGSPTPVPSCGEKRTPLIASVGYFPEQIRRRADPPRPRSSSTHKPVPPAVFVRHHVITPENVDHFYPNDVLLGVDTARF